MQAVLNGVRFSHRQMAKQQDNELVLVTDPDIPPVSAAMAAKYGPILIRTNHMS